MRQYLNHDDRWPRFRRAGLEVEPGTGALTLRRLPGPPREVGCVPGHADDDVPAAGVAADPGGGVYLADPAGGRLYGIAPVVAAARQVAEVGRRDDDPPAPLGLLVQRCRGRLLVADRDGHRILVLDPVTGQLVGVWGQPWPDSPPCPAARHGGLDGPEWLAEDSAGGVYAVDRRADGTGRRRVAKFDADGNTDPAFRAAVTAALAAWCLRVRRRFAPCGVAVGRWPDPGEKDERDRVLVLGTVPAADGGDAAELWGWVFAPDGRPQGPIRLLDAVAPPPDPAAVASVGVVLTIDPRDRTQHGPGATPAVRLRGFAAIGTMLFVGVAGQPAGGCSAVDREPDRVWCFELVDTLGPGTAEPSWLPLYDGRVAGLAARGRGDAAELVVSAGPGRPVVALPHRGAFRTQGAFLAGPFTGLRGRDTPWHRVRFAGGLGDAGRAQFFTLSRLAARPEWADPPRPRADRLPGWFRPEDYADLFDRLGFGADTEPGPPDLAAVEVAPLRRPGESALPADPGLTAPDRWFAAPDGQSDFLARNSGGTPTDPADRFWVFGLLAGDGRSAPRFTQARLEYDEDGWLADLPECYRRDARGRVFLRSLLALFESVFGDATDAVDRLPALFVPDVAAAAFGPGDGALEWLAGCLALELPAGPADRDEVTRAIRRGPDLLAHRGTPGGLARLVKARTGVEVYVEETGVEAGTVMVGDGFGALAPAAPDGVVLGRDPVGQAALGDPLDPRPAAPADLAFHFVVRGYLPDLADPDRRALVNRAVRLAAPAHTTYSVQAVEPRLRVGVQARLGVDAVVGPADPVAPLVVGLPPGPDARLAPSPDPPAVGRARLGADTPLN